MTQVHQRAAHTTTVRLRAETRQRLNALAEQLGSRTVDDTVNSALDSLERQIFWEQVKVAHAEITLEEAAADATEMEAWDRAASLDYADSMRTESADGR